MKRLIIAFSFILAALVLLASPALAIESTIGGIDTNGNARYSVNSSGDMYSASGTYKYAYMPMSYTQSVVEFAMAAPGTALTASGLSGVAEIGSTEGYVELENVLDAIYFSISLPDNFYDGGAVGDLILSFDMSEATAGTVTDLTVTAYQQSSTTAIFADTIAIANGGARGYKELVTLSTGMGADSDIDSDDTLIFCIQPKEAEDNVYVYGARLKYRVGQDVTQG